VTDSALISVITVVRNGARTLEHAILSVLTQKYENVEYIIVDGVSTDGTLDILKAYNARIRWISEPDNGIYDAMNKGLSLANGQWIYFLGADDRLSSPETLFDVAPSLDPALSLVFGKIRYPDGKIVRSRLGLRTLLHNTVHHQGAFYHSRLFKGWRYDDNYKIVADYELNLLLYLKRQAYAGVEEDIAICGDMGASLKQWEIAVAETNAIRRKHMWAFANTLFSALNGIEMAIYRLFLLLQRRTKS